jgi:iron complex outermembrane receptor protein
MQLCFQLRGQTGRAKDATGNLFMRLMLLSEAEAGTNINSLFGNINNTQILLKYLV